jgi:signal transduction histidine kinase/CheY-like chemotaxis protein/Skp family chaperone for outer membrane proteins
MTPISFRTLSIKGKLMLVTMLTSSVALLVASAGFLVYDLVAFRARMSQDLMTEARIIGANTAAGLAFHDERAVGEILAALKARDETVSAALYTPNGELFASYLRADVAGLPPRRQGSGYHFADNRLEVSQQIVLHGEALGTLQIVSDMRHWDARLKRYTNIVFFLMFGAAGIAFLFSSKLQTVISRPILDLERTMRTVSNHKNFSLRAPKAHDDEVGALIDGFNTMLSEIQQRDTALQAANEDLQARTRQLEQEIAERLRTQEELKSLNATLEQRVAERSAAAEQRSLELAQSQHALEKQTRILQSILNSMSDGVIVADDEGRFILFNPAAENILHRRLTEGPTETWSERFGFHLADAVTPYPPEEFPLVKAIRGHAVDVADVFIRHSGIPEGLWVSVNATPLRDEEGVLHNGVAVLHNITTHKRAEEALLKAKDAAEAANRAKSQFLANMSHELRTPLNAIIGYSEMLQEQALDSGQDESIPDLQKIHSAGRHLQSLIDHILDLSKIEAGKLELFLETFDVGDVVRDVLTTIGPLVERNGNTLQAQYDDLGVIRADMTRLRQILFNLLSNACKFTERGSVRLDAFRQLTGGTEWIHFRVSDTGIGMTPEQSSRLFQEFTQVDASTTRKYGGTGLGLAISKRFSEMMGGEISVESVLGAGSTFSVCFPVGLGTADEDREPAADRTGGYDASSPAVQNTVLVIDDDPVVHDLMTRFLAKDGVRVVVASAGEEGLALARRLHPAAITLDVMMPGMDGWTVLATLKADPQLSSIPVVMVTMTDDRRTGYALGASDYLTKPIDPGRLSAALRRQLGDAAPTASVLIVDDDPAVRRLTHQVLQREGWTVLEAENGRIGLGRVVERHPALIILDLLMPDMDGFEFLDQLRQTDVAPTIPIIVLTAKDLTAADRESLNGSVAKVLDKSICNREELLVAVREQVKARLFPQAVGS